MDNQSLCNITPFALVEKCFHLRKFIANLPCEQNMPWSPSHPASLKGSGEGNVWASRLWQLPKVNSPLGMSPELTPGASPGDPTGTEEVGGLRSKPSVSQQHLENVAKLPEDSGLPPSSLRDWSWDHYGRKEINRRNTIPRCFQY